MNVIRHPIIGGEAVKGNAGERAIINPFDSSELGRVTYADREQAASAVELADSIFRTKKLSGKERSVILGKASELILQRKDEITSTIVKEAGKPKQYARSEADRASFTFLAASKAALGFDEPITPDLRGAPNAVGRAVSYNYFPIGVICSITPFNFPLNLVAHKVAPAIASGNTIVLKPAPQTPLSSFLLEDILKESGLPDGWLNVVPCENDIAQYVIQDERVKMLSFTGSANVGWYLKSLIPKKKVTLELGGNGAVIVDEATDIDSLVKSLVIAGYSYAGQVCISLQNLYIKDTIYDEVAARFVEIAKQVAVGDPMDGDVIVGPMIAHQAAEKAWSWVEDAVAKGATKLCGEFRAPNIITPTILENVPNDCNVSCEEVFAPVVVLHKYSDIDEVVKELNTSRYGLQAGLFSSKRDIVERVYQRLEVGGLIVGDTNTFRIDTMPYGGVKDSGYGREGVEFAMREMCDIKVLVEKQS
ncbi:MAG TPA: aldehyde dehydrogenase family protein [Candidatus Kapabacteria bacterium]